VRFPRFGQECKLSEYGSAEYGQGYILSRLVMAFLTLLLFWQPGLAEGRKTGLPPGLVPSTCGNSNFGEWITDEFGLPAFRHNGCSVDSCKGEGKEPGPTKTFHQLGNGSVTARAFIDGYVELFTAKTYYRFANHYDENANANNFAGGLGWVRVGEKVWSTLYADRPTDGSKYDRQFGMGYYKKTIEYDDLRLEH